MLNLSKPVKYSANQSKFIASNAQNYITSWKSTSKINTNIKDCIKGHLEKSQGGKCVYCGLILGGTSREEIEHIANKSRYPEFTYTEQNLALVCSHCNGSSKKGDKDVVSKLNKDYKSCEFTIVHPYLDDVDHYLDTRESLIKVKDNLSQDELKRARQTIELFKLYASQIVEARKKEIMIEILNASGIHNNHELTEMLELISKYRRDDTMD